MIIVLIAICVSVLLWHPWMPKTHKMNQIAVTPDAGEKIVTVFFQGIGASRVQAAKFAGPAGVYIIGNNNTAQSGTRASIPHAPLLIYNVFPHPELDEIGYGFSYNPARWPFLFASCIQNIYYGVNGWWPSLIHYNRIEKIEMAGENNVRHHGQAVRDCIEQHHPNKSIVLFGTSRGAATTFISVSLLPKEIQSKIALVVLEAPPDSVENVLKKRAPYFFPWNLRLFERFTAYDPRYSSAMGVSDRYPLDVPTAFIMSKADKDVPMECTLNLISALQLRKHTKFHTLILDHSDHSGFPIHNENEQTKYKLFMDDLYKKYIPQLSV